MAHKGGELSGTGVDLHAHTRIDANDLHLIQRTRLLSVPLLKVTTVRGLICLIRKTY